jgi:hypothetical protein
MPRTERIAVTTALTDEALLALGWGFVPPIAANELTGATVINMTAIRARHTDFFMDNLLFWRSRAHFERNWYPTLVLRKSCSQKENGKYFAFWTLILGFLNCVTYITSERRNLSCGAKVHGTKTRQRAFSFVRPVRNCFPRLNRIHQVLLMQMEHSGEKASLKAFLKFWDDPSVNTSHLSEGGKKYA